MTVAFPELRDELVKCLTRLIAISETKSAEAGEVDEIIEFFVGVLQPFRHLSQWAGQLFRNVGEMEAVDIFIDELEQVAYANANLDEGLLNLPEWPEIVVLANDALGQLVR